MTRTLGDRTLFFLRHRRQIEEWANLRQEAVLEAHDFFASLATPLEGRCASLPGEPQCHASFSRDPVSRIFLVHRTWRRLLGSPVAGVGLEWPTEALFEDAYTGVWHDGGRQPASRSQERHACLVAALQPLVPMAGGRASGPGAFQTAPNWPCYRYERPGPEFWTREGLDEFAEYLVGAVADLWAVTWEAVHSCLSELDLDVPEQ